MAKCVILIYGGTFDPPHRAHVELPALVAERLSAERIIYVPTSSNPLKDEQPTPARHRLAMLRFALRDCSRCEINEMELGRDGPAYTVETLEQLRVEYAGNVELRLLLGADAAISFHRWKNPERILDLATPVVMLRPPWDRDAFRAKLLASHSAEQVERWLGWTVDVPVIDIDATLLRTRIAAEEDVSDDLAPAVLEYIREHGLYKDEQT